MVTLRSRHDITLDAYRRVAWEGESVEIAPEAVLQMAAAHRGFLDLIESNPDLSVYMVTTGGGSGPGNGSRPTSGAGPTWRRGSTCSFAFGDPLPERVTRGFVMARLANFLGGHAAAHPSVAEAIAAMLDGRTLPPVPRRGQGGSGEIIPLGHLFGPERGIATEPKARNALVNGSPCAAALVADAVLAAEARLELAADAFALSIEAIRAPLENYSSALDGLWDDWAETEALQALRARLRGRGRRAQELPDPRQLADCAPGAWSGPSGRRAGETGCEHLPGGGHRQPRLRAARRRSSDGTDVLDGWLPQQRRLAGPRCHERLVGRPLPVG